MWSSSVGNNPKQGPTEPQGSTYPLREGGGGGVYQGDTWEWLKTRGIVSSYLGIYLKTKSHMMNAHLTLVS